MARQTGVFPIEGTIGGVIFYQNKHGYLARAKGGVSREQVATEPRFERTRETGSEFGYASRVGKLLRHGVKVCCPWAEDGDTNYRLAAQVMKAVQEDTTNVRGARRLSVANTQMLEGFEWRERGRVGDVLQAPFVITVDNVAGSVEGRITDFVPMRDMVMPKATTHVELCLGVVRVDYKGNKQVSAVARSVAFDLKDGGGGELVLSCGLPAGGEVVMVGIGVQGFQMVSGELVRLREGAGFLVGKVLVG